MFIGIGIAITAPIPGGGVSYDADAQLIFDAFTTPPDTTRKGLINTCVLALKAAGVWTKLDALYMFAAADSQAALINWKDPGTFDATAVNSPTFTADEGFTATGSTTYVNSNYNTSSDAVNFTQNDAAMFAYSLTDQDKDNGSIIGTNMNLTSRLGINPMNASGTSASRALNSTAETNSLPPADTIGLFTVSRDNSSNYDAYDGASNLGTITSASAAPQNATVKFCGGISGSVTHWSARTISLGGIGGSLSDAQVSALVSAFDDYLTAVGAI